MLGSQEQRYKEIGLPGTGTQGCWAPGDRDTEVLGSQHLSWGGLKTLLPLSRLRAVVGVSPQMSPRC